MTARNVATRSVVCFADYPEGVMSDAFDTLFYAIAEGAMFEFMANTNKGLSVEEMVIEYRKRFKAEGGIVMDGTKKKKKKKDKKEVGDEKEKQKRTHRRAVGKEACRAIVKSNSAGERCSRKHLENEIFCRIHLNRFKIDPNDVVCVPTDAESDSDNGNGNDSGNDSDSEAKKNLPVMMMIKKKKRPREEPSEGMTAVKQDVKKYMDMKKKSAVVAPSRDEDEDESETEIEAVAKSTTTATTATTTATTKAATQAATMSTSSEEKNAKKQKLAEAPKKKSGVSLISKVKYDGKIYLIDEDMNVYIENAMGHHVRVGTFNPDEEEIKFDNGDGSDSEVSDSGIVKEDDDDDFDTGLVF